MADAIHIESLDMKCDAEGCDHVEKVSRVTRDLIGKPCPKCGANLLTEADYRSATALLDLAASINEAVGPIEPSGNAPRVSINPHDGALNITVRDAR